MGSFTALNQYWKIFSMYSAPHLLNHPALESCTLQQSPEPFLVAREIFFFLCAPIKTNPRNASFGKCAALPRSVTLRGHWAGVHGHRNKDLKLGGVFISGVLRDDQNNFV